MTWCAAAAAQTAQRAPVRRSRAQAVCAAPCWAVCERGALPQPHRQPSAPPQGSRRGLPPASTRKAPPRLAHVPLVHVEGLQAWPAACSASHAVRATWGGASARSPGPPLAEARRGRRHSARALAYACGPGGMSTQGELHCAHSINKPAPRDSQARSRRRGEDGRGQVRRAGTGRSDPGRAEPPGQPGRAGPSGRRSGRERRGRWAW